MIRWVVQPSDPRALGALEVVTAAALADGRVFIGRRRERSADAAVCDGDVVTVHAPTTAYGEVELLLWDGELCAITKPPDLPTIPDHHGTRAAITDAARLVGLPLGALHATSRLDVGVSGVVVFAAGAAARSRLERLRQDGAYRRTYVAIASGSVEHEGAWSAPIGRARDPRLRAVNGRDALAAETRFAPVSRAADATLLEVRPQTGRTHQIRVHAAHAGHALLGDRAYGGPRRVVDRDGRVFTPTRIALHAWEVSLGDDDAPLVLRAPVPPSVLEVWRALGGDDGALAEFGGG